MFPGRSERGPREDWEEQQHNKLKTRGHMEARKKQQVEEKAILLRG